MVEKLVVVDIAPVRYQTNHDELIAALQSLPVDTIASRSQADGILADRINDPSLRQFLLQNLIRDENGFKWRINLDAIQRNHSRLRDFPLELEGRVFSRPVMFLSGSLSGYVLPGYQEVIRTYFPNAENIAIAGANHWVHADKPEQVIQKVRKFLNR
jgi:pimeloyl-ACP methyl ester carboxylesterase